MTAIAGSIALVTGANRGIGRAFVDELLLAGATKVYAGARDPNRAAIDDDNVEVVQLDVTDPPSVAAAAAHCADVSLLLNNAGYFANKRLVLTDDPDAARQEMEVNFWGALAMTRAFAPILGANGGGAIVNVLSVAGAVPAAFMGGYSTSKAATYSCWARWPRTRRPHGGHGCNGANRPGCTPRRPGTARTSTSQTAHGRNPADAAMSTWADLRQVVFASSDPDRDGGQARALLGLGRGFGDPELADHGLTDDTMAVGQATFLEIVSPTTAEHPIAGWLAKRNGAAGYLLSIQVADIDACLLQCAAEGVRVTLTHVVQGHTIAQLHPRDMGVAAELDGISIRGAWFWDSLDIDRRAEARVDDVLAVEIAVAEPGRMAARWAAVLGLEAVENEVALGARVLRFVAAGADRGGLTAVELHAGSAADDGVELELCNTRIRLVH